MPYSDVSWDHKNIRRAVRGEKKYSQKQLTNKIKQLEVVRDQLLDFIPWPRLIQSFNLDIRDLETLLDRVKADA